MERYYIRRKDGKYYVARAKQHSANPEHRWSDDFSKVRLYTRPSFAKRTIDTVPLNPAEVEVLPVDITASVTP